MQKPIRPTSYDAIIEAAFKTYNKDPTSSLADIALTAGVGRATLHRHFSGRDDLIQAMALKALVEIEAAAELATTNVLSYKAALKQILRAMVSLGDRHWFLAQECIERFPQIYSKLEQQKKEFSKVITGAQKEGLFHRDCPQAWIAQAYDHLIHAAWEMLRDGLVTENQAADLAWVTLTRGLKYTKL